MKFDFAPRVRQISALLIKGLTSKQIGKRLMRKLGAATTGAPVNRLLVR